MDEIMSLYRMGVPISEIAKKLHTTELEVMEVVGDIIPSDPTKLLFAKKREKKERPVTIRGKKYLDMTDWFNG